MLNFEELRNYLRDMAFKDMKMTNRQVRELFPAIDLDGNGLIDKDEMALFLNLILVQQECSQNQKINDPLERCMSLKAIDKIGKKPTANKKWDK